nr:uncharacterized protein c5e4.10c [Quercus suber]
MSRDCDCVFETSRPIRQVVRTRTRTPTMPLHLLGKKSWHVYNADNVSRVRRDEADAQARREAAEQRMQAEDAAYRTALLRGEDPVKPTVSSSFEAEDEEEDESLARGREDGARKRSRRRLRGEDDTDRDIRFAREDVEAGSKARQTLLLGSAHKSTTSKRDDTSIVDAQGHIRLFAEPSSVASLQDREQNDGNQEKKRRKEERVSKMRLDDAAGYNDSMQKGPWYASNKHANLTSQDPNTNDHLLANVPDKDVWGNEDPRRKSREQSRITSSDPFAAMQQAQSQLKQKQRDRMSWEKQQAKDLAELRDVDEDRRRRHSEHRRHRAEADDLDGFTLDSLADGKGRGGARHRSRKHRHHSRSSDKLDHQKKSCRT